MISSPGAYSLHRGDVEDAQDLLVDEVPEQRHPPQHVDLARQLLGAVVGGRRRRPRPRALDAHDDGGDVVVAAARVGQVDQLLGQRLDVVALEDVDDARVVQVGVQAVRAEQELVAGQDLEVDRVALDGLVDADRARDRVLVRLVRGGLEALLGERAAPDQLVDQRVVLGELDHLAGAQHVDAAVADVGDEAAVAGDEQRRRGGPHAALLRLGLALVVDGLAGRLDRVLEQRQDVLRADASASPLA